MIVREKEDHFILIQQNHHATLSGLLAKFWKEELFPETSLRRSVEYAASHHDIGWVRFDKTPFLNDKTQTPYSFNDFPDVPKTVLYTFGIEAVMKEDPYAALLCSAHFVNFFQDAEEKEVIQFIQAERKRQASLRSQMTSFHEEAFAAHLDLLQFVDGLSLFVCLNDPGTPAEEGHPFFQEGLPVPPSLNADDPVIRPVWLDGETVALNFFPFDEPAEGSIVQKKVSKRSLSEHGLLESYREADEEEMTIRFVAQEK